jgi:hypothetical protein
MVPPETPGTKSAVPMHSPEKTMRGPSDQAMSAIGPEEERSERGRFAPDEPVLCSEAELRETGDELCTTGGLWGSIGAAAYFSEPEVARLF